MNDEGRRSGIRDGGLVFRMIRFFSDNICFLKLGSNDIFAPACFRALPFILPEVILMNIHLISRRCLVLLFAALSLATACTDSPTAPARTAEPVLLTADFVCTVDVAVGAASCREAGMRVNGAQLNVILGGSYVSLTYSGTTNFRGDPANEDTTTTNISLKNNIGQPIGTTDGINADPTGTRLFFSSTPTVTGVTSGTIAGSTVRVDNPDGTGTFGTFVNKPYFQYDGVLATNATYPSLETVRYVYSSNVKSFSFGLRVSAPVQYEHGWITVAPATVPVLASGQTATLTGTVYDAAGAVQADAITWSSSNMAVATVNSSTGEVTAVAQGMATITATSTVNAQRTGTRVLTVDAAPTVTSTTPTNGATAFPVTGNIVIDFGEAVNVTGSAFALECPTGSPQAFTVSGTGTSALTLTPTTDLPVLTHCTVTVVGNEVTDVDTNDGPNMMASDYVFSFETAADEAPTVVSTTPADGATSIASNSNIVITFSEPVVVSTNSFLLECPVSYETFDVTVSGSGTSAITLDPVVDLPEETTCTVTVAASVVSDADANDGPDGMVLDHVFSFEVGP